MTAVTILYSALVSMAITSTEDHIAKRYLEQELNAILAQEPSSDGQFQLPNTSYLNSFHENSANLPPSYLELGPGYHEIENTDRHLAIVKIPQSEKRIFLEMNEAKLSSLDQNEGIINSALLVVAGLVIITGLLMAIITARLLSKPIIDLALETKHGWRPEKPLAGAERQDEIGTLSRALSQLLQQQAQSLENEKSFTRHASHEMRTPISVIKNSSAVLNLPNCNTEKTERNTQRINDSCADLELIINTFLMLGRQSSESFEETEILLTPVVQSALKRSAHTINSKGIEIEILDPNNSSINANDALLKVALNNLIRNAAHHGHSTLHIELSSNQLIITNPVDTTQNSTPDSYGYGIEIVHRICDAQSWKLLTREEDQQYIATLIFNKNDVA